MPSKWLREHQEEKRLYNKQYYQEHREEILQRHKVNSRIYCRDLKWEILVHYSENGYPACKMCGEQRLPCLSIDHINNTKIKGHRSGFYLYMWLRKNGFPEGFQVLCMNCQFLKEHERRTGESYV